MKILGIIPARQGSKGIKNKNIKKINNIPLINYTIHECLKSKIFDKLIVTTDSKKIATISRKAGALVPFLRPKYLAKDKSLAIPTIKHALKKTEEIYNENFDIVCMLQPTTPLRRAKDCIKIKNIMKNNLNKIDSIISVVNVNNNHPIKMKKINKNNFLVDYVNWSVENPPRQSLPPVYIVNGAFYMCKRDVILKQNSFKGNNCLPFIMDPKYSINIDSEIDFKLAEIILNSQRQISIR